MATGSALVGSGGDVSDSLVRLPEKWRPSLSEYTLYWHPLSQPSRAVAQILEEGGIPHKRVDIDINKKREQKNPLYLEIINSVGKVPVIYHFDTKKFQNESADIMRYIAQKYKDKLYAWYPADDTKTAAYIDEMLVWVSDRVRPISKGILKDVVVLKNSNSAQQYSKQVPQLAAEIENCFKQALERFQSTNSEKKEKDEHKEISAVPVVYLAGTSHPTIADLQLLHELDIDHELGIFPWDTTNHPLLDRWYHVMANRPVSKNLSRVWAWPMWFASGILKVNSWWFGKYSL